MKIAEKDLKLFAYTNRALLREAPRGIVLQFIGLGGNTRMITEDPEEAKLFAARSILFVIPYIQPWAWMNRASVSLTDAVVACLIEAMSLPEDIPLISTGGSMGGQCALAYACHAAKTPTAVAANCPVCDLPYHYTERADLPRTLYAAFGDYGMPLEDAMKTASPIHLAEKMPDVPYFIVHCEEDRSVNKEKHSDRLVKLLMKDHDVRYCEVPGRGHCDLSPEAKELWYGFIFSACEKKTPSEDGV
ncbi:MAG: prolyl oligopeptidase family serine peptidase [Clostridia bacterium]|nr:prolyl oligopeptidase family serine peptidase [Clostridia bacterium]